MRVRRLVAGTAAILLSILGLGAPVAAAPEAPPVTVSTSIIDVGRYVTFSERFFTCAAAADDGSDQVVITLDGVPVAAEPIAADGEWWATIQVPDEPGTYTYQTTCYTEAGPVTYAPRTITVLPPRPDDLSVAIGEPTRDGCTVSIPVTTTSAYTFEMQVWDDQRVIQNTVWQTEGDETHVVEWTITGRPDPTFEGDIYFTVRVNGSPVLGPDGKYGVSYSYPDEVADACSADVPVSAVLGENPMSVQPGQTVTIAGEGFLAGETIDVTLEESGAVIGGRQGRSPRYLIASDPYSVSATLPSDLSPGQHVLVLTGQTSLRTARVTVTAPEETPIPDATSGPAPESDEAPVIPAPDATSGPAPGPTAS